MKMNANFEKHLDQWTDFCSWARFYPDLFLDLIKPERGGINLSLDQRIFLRCAMRFYSVYGVFPRGYAKCVKGDTMILTDHGIKEIGEYFDYNQSGEETYYTIQDNIVNRYLNAEKCYQGVYNGLQKTKTLLTTEGYEITGTLVHPILTMDSKGQFDYKLINNIQVGDKIPIARGMNIWGQELNIDYEDELKQWVLSLSKQSASHLKIKSMPKILTEDIAEVLGQLVGDGCMTLDNRIGFTNIDKELIDFYCSTMQNVFNVKVHKKQPIDYIISDKYLRKYLELLGMPICNAHGKVVPHVILKAPKEIVCAFLRGLFDTDGSVNEATVTFSSVSYKLISQVRFMLLNVGIIARVKHRYNKKGFDHYFLVISGTDLDIFQDEIGFRLTRKKVKLDTLCNKRHNTNKDIIPIDNKIITEYYNEAKKYTAYAGQHIEHILSGECQLTYPKLRYLLSLNNAEQCVHYQILKDIWDNHYYFATISEINQGNNHVYDIVMPETNSFISNGFISHNTFNEVLAGILTCIFYPGVNIALSAQTKENAADLLQSKYNEIMKFYPILANEVETAKFQKNGAGIVFKNGSTYDILANAQSSKGQRRQRITVEESALLNNDLFQDVLEPIVNIGRHTVGTASITDPCELNHQINFFTTSGFRGTDEYLRNVQMIRDMINLKGSFVFGAGWELACWYGRGLTKSATLKKKSDMSTVAFAQNYESKWVGVSDNALVDINRLMNCRTLTRPMYESNNEDDEIYLGVDVARSEKKANNQSSIAVVRVIRNSTGKVVRLELINTIGMSNTLNFTAQAIEVKRARNRYHARAVASDGNGLSSGLIDELLQSQIDPETGEVLECWDTMNTDNKPENELLADRCLWDIKAQGNQTKIIVDFIDAVDSGKLKMLEHRRESDFTTEERDNMEREVVPFIQTDFLFEEIANLKLKKAMGANLVIEQATKRVNKDRFSALAYAIYYIMEYENDYTYQDISDIDMLSEYTFV